MPRSPRPERLESATETELHEESPWGDLRGKPLDARGLAYRLRKYDARPITITVAGPEEKRLKGYVRADLADAWTRYLPAPKSPDLPFHAFHPMRPERMERMERQIRSYPDSFGAARADTRPHMRHLRTPLLWDPRSQQRGTCAACDRDAQKTRRTA